MALRTGYGTGVYGSSKYGLPEVYEGAATVSASASVTAAGQRIHIGTATASAAATASCSAQRIHIGTVAITPSVSVTVVGYTALAGSATITPAASVAISYNRVRPFSASDSAALDASVISRYKWLDTSVGAVSWADADYREGAA